MLYIVIPQESRITKRLEKIEQKQEEQFERIFEFSTQCQDDINEVKEKTYKYIDEKIDKLIAMINKVELNK